MDNFYQQLNESPWKGIISEVGIGLEFSSRLLRVPGASKTVIGVNCPYNDSSLPSDMSAVSLENARRLAEANLEGAYKNQKENVFGLAITGAHYIDRESHAWIYLATPKWDAYMHCSIDKNSSREWVGSVLVSRIQWFLNACLLSKQPWIRHIEDIGDTLETHNIDVLYAPGMSDAERMAMLRPLNPLVYSQGEFRRVLNYLRTCSAIYPGSFNPPTRAHLKARNCLFEISQTHCYKPPVSIEDMLHRCRMLNAEGQSVLFTQTPLFIDKHDLIVQKGLKEVSFLMGVDTWNIFTDPSQYPSHDWLSARLPYAKFLIRPRNGFNANVNDVTNMLSWKHVFDLPDTEACSSTDVRNLTNPHTHAMLTPSVANYIEKHKLYG